MTKTLPRILAVDDAPANLLSLARALEADFEFQLATSGAEAIRLASASPPDLILLDVLMPDMDGFETCRRLKADARTADIPIVFVTVLSDIGDEASGLALGAADYITKPIAIEIARQRIRNLIEREKLRQEVEAQRQLLELKVIERTRDLEQRMHDLEVAKEAADTARRAKEALLANVGHELRTPMNGIVGLVGMLRRRCEDPSLAQRLETMAQLAEQLMRLLNDILDLAHLESEKLTLTPEPFRLGELVTALDRQFAPKAAARGLGWRCAGSPPAERNVIGDATRIQQILGNLMANAIKFSERGEIRWRTDIVSETGTDVTVRFEVADQGIGISPEMQPCLFEPFLQADPSLTRRFGGTGIGLAIGQRLARLMGGEISVVSTLGEGSIFALTIRFEKSVETQQQPVAAGTIAEDEPSVFDETALLARLNQDRTLAAAIIASSLQDLPGYFARLHRAVEDGCWKEAERVTHAMKSVLGQLGGLRAAALMTDANGRLKRGDPLAIGEVEQMQAEYRLLANLLESWKE